MADKTKGMLDTVPRSKDHTFVELNSKLQSGASGKNLNQISKNWNFRSQKKSSLNDYPTAKRHIGVSLNGGYPHFTPQVLIIFSRKNPLKLLGKPTILGNPQKAGSLEGLLCGFLDLFSCQLHQLFIFQDAGDFHHLRRRCLVV